MDHPRIVSRADWLIARAARQRKGVHARERDALTAVRRRLPMVEIRKEYVFKGRQVPSRCAISLATADG
jgi:predicted dithiol-disulfide oxidoreductase (DUF899 family)